MQKEQKSTAQLSVEELEVYTFKREEGRWYLCLDAYRAQGWKEQDLELSAGAKVLNRLAEGKKFLRLRLSADLFEGANLLELIERCAAPRGGGIYLLNPEKENDGSLYWICDLALLVFGDTPERIYVKRLPLKDKEALKETMTISFPLQQAHNPSWFKRPG